MKKISIVLCGSGFLDGSEIRESVGVLWALSAAGADVQCFAPNGPQADVMNCLTRKPASGESRNMLIEAARIARGQIKPLEELKPAEFDALILPGGFGAAKNLCDFASKGSKGTVLPKLQEILESFHKSSKPIGAVCIAPAIVGLAFKGKGFELTLGAGGEAAQEIEKLGHHHIVRAAKQAHTDREHKIVTTPAYMYDGAPLHEIFEGIRTLVNEVIGM